MTRRKKTLLASTLVAALLVTLARLVYIHIGFPLTDQGKAKSPDGRYLATFHWKEYQTFWTGDVINRITFSVQATDGRVIRHITTEEPTVGWVEGISINWAKNSSNATLVFKYTSGPSRTRVIVSVD